MKTLVSIVVATVGLGLAYGQGTSSFDAQVADFRLLVDKKVQADVGISKQELAKLNVYADQNRDRIRAYQEEVRRQGKDPRKIADNDPTLIRYFIELQQQVLTHLTPKQLQRLRELTLQSVGLRGLLDSNVAKRIGITEVQLKKARAIFEKGATANQKLTANTYSKVIAPFKSQRPKTQAEADALNAKIRSLYEAEIAKKNPEIKKLADQTKRDLESVVTSKQLAAYKALGGKPFVPR